MSAHVIPVRTTLIIFAALMGLLLATIGIARLDLGAFNLAAALTIATTKAVLILLYFMHVRYSDRLVWLFSSAAFFWLGIMIVLTLNDYLTRGWLDVAGK